MTKKEKLQEFKQKLQHTVNPIDKCLLKTVAVLNAFNIHAFEACEGSLDHSTPYPWIDIAPIQTELQKEYWQQYVKLCSEIQIKNSEQARITEVNELLENSRKILFKARKPLLEDLKITLELLSEFYHTRTVAYHRKLILVENTNKATLTTQGALIQDIIPLNLRKMNLILYLEEIKDFTQFLERKYLET